LKWLITRLHVKEHTDSREGTGPQQTPLTGCSYSEKFPKSESDLAYTDYSQVVYLSLAQART